MFLKRTFSVATLLMFLFGVLVPAFSIQSVESAPETQTPGNSGQVSTCEDQISQLNSLSNIMSPRFSDESIGETSILDKLERDFKFGKICIDQYMLYRAWRVFDPGKVPKEYALPSEETQLYRRSGTMVILEIKKNWDNLNPETQNELEFVFKRPTDSGGGFDDKKHLLPRLYSTTNFVMHWTNGTDGGSRADAVPLGDANANGVPDYVEDFAEIFENVMSFEVDNRGFHAPPDDAAEPNDVNRRNPDYRYDIFIYNMSVYGYAHLEQSNIPSYSFMGVDNDYLGFPTPQLQAMQVTAAHEFFHAIQYYYSLTEVIDAYLWWMEATSTYMEDEVYPDVNDNYQYLPGWFENCDRYGLIGLTFEDQGYGDFIFAKRLSEDFGDDVIREIWEETAVDLVILAINNVLLRRGSNFISEFSRFTVANFFLEDMYVDGADYRKILTESEYCQFSGVYLEYEYDASFERDYTVINKTNVYRNAWMDMWATNYITIRLDPAAEKYRIFFDGLDPTTNSNYLVKLATKKAGAIQSTPFSLNAQQGYVDLSYDKFDNVTLIIANAGFENTTDPSWRIIVSKFTKMESLRYDDGTAENVFSWTGGGKFAVRFTPSMSGRLMECSFCILNPAAVKIHVMDNQRTDVITPFTKTPTSNGWFHVDLSAFQLFVTAQVDFYIAIEWTVSGKPMLLTDLDDPDGRSWDNNGASWSLAPLKDGDYLIGAIVAAVTPDLTISDISWSPSNPIEGDVVTFSACIKNLGSVDAGSFKVAYYIDDSKVGEWSITSLQAGKNVTKSFTWTAIKGDHTVKAFADSDFNIEERVETNNEREEVLRVAPKPKPDLMIRDISWTPETPVGGDTVTFTVIIKNNGTANAGSFKTAYYINQTKLGEWSTTSLSGGQEVNKTFTWTYIEGSHVVKAIADSGGGIQEDDETNNAREEIIGNLPPEASFSCNGRDCLSNPTAYVRKSTRFNATESYDPDGSIVSYSWDFGDGNVTTVTDAVITHNYTRTGNYTVTLNVTDNLGMWQTTAGNVTVKLKCDLNNDGVVNVVDITIVSVAFNSKPEDPNWNQNVDFDNDHRITIVDITVVTIEFGAKA